VVLELFKRLPHIVGSRVTERVADRVVECSESRVDSLGLRGGQKLMLVQWKAREAGGRLQ
jgi:hypothetical protein